LIDWIRENRVTISRAIPFNFLKEMKNTSNNYFEDSEYTDRSRILDAWLHENNQANQLSKLALKDMRKVEEYIYELKLRIISLTPVAKSKPTKLESIDMDENFLSSNRRDNSYDKDQRSSTNDSIKSASKRLGQLKSGFVHLLDDPENVPTYLANLVKAIEDVQKEKKQKSGWKSYFPADESSGEEDTLGEMKKRKKRKSFKRPSSFTLDIRSNASESIGDSISSKNFKDFVPFNKNYFRNKLGKNGEVEYEFDDSPNDGKIITDGIINPVEEVVSNLRSSSVRFDDIPQFFKEENINSTSNVLLSNRESFSTLNDESEENSTAADIDNDDDLDNDDNDDLVDEMEVARKEAIALLQRDNQLNQLIRDQEDIKEQLLRNVGILQDEIAQHKQELSWMNNQHEISFQDFSKLASVFITVLISINKC
jgi:hypothetical protein